MMADPSHLFSNAAVHGWLHRNSFSQTPFPRPQVTPEHAECPALLSSGPEGPSRLPKLPILASSPVGCVKAAHLPRRAGSSHAGREARGLGADVLQAEAQPLEQAAG